MALTCLFLFLLLSFFWVPTIRKHHFSSWCRHFIILLYKEEYNDTRAHNTYNAIHFRALYIYIFAEDLQLLLFRVVGWSLFSFKRNTPQEKNGEEERNHRPTTKNTRLFVFVLNLRALIYLRVSLSLLRSFEKKRKRRSTKRNEEEQQQHRNNRLKEEDNEEERKRRARDDDIIVTSSRATGHQKLSLHLPFRVFKVVIKLSEKIRERGQQIFYSSSSE